MADTLDAGSDGFHIAEPDPAHEAMRQMYEVIQTLTTAVKSLEATVKSHEQALRGQDNGR